MNLIAGVEFHQPATADPDILDQYIQACNSSRARIPVDVENAEWTAQKRILLDVVRALDHDELTRLGASSLLRRIESQEVVRPAQRSYRADFYPLIQHRPQYKSQIVVCNAFPLWYDPRAFDGPASYESNTHEQEE